MPDPKAEYKLFYAILVAGKSARFAQFAMERLQRVMRDMGVWTGDWMKSLAAVQEMGGLRGLVVEARTGNYDKMQRAIESLLSAKLDLMTCTIEQLEEIHGIAQKTSRFFLRWTGRRMRFAVLDVHILRWMAEQGVENVPRATPGSKREYARLEREFLRLADEQGIHPADLDEKLWLERNKSGIRT